jgi:predicted DNA-binding ribbon-helix-helix protein
LTEAAAQDGKTVAMVVADIDRGRQGLNLSSAIRVWVLRRLQARISASIPGR